MSIAGKIRLFQLTFFGAILGLWFGVTETGYVSPIFLPKLPDLAAKFTKLLASGEWMSPLSVTLFEVACAYGLTAINPLKNSI